MVSYDGQPPGEGWNIPGSFPGTSDHSTTDSEESLYLNTLMSTQEDLRQFHRNNAIVFAQPAVADAHDEFPPLMVLRTEFSWVTAGFGFFHIPPDHLPPIGGAYLPAHSWERMLPEAGLPPYRRPPVPAEPPPPQMPLYYRPPISGASEPAGGLSFSKPPMPNFFADRLPNYICKMPAVFLAPPPLKSGPPTAPSTEPPVGQIPPKAVPTILVVNQPKPAPPVLGQHAAKAAVEIPQKAPPPLPVPVKKCPPQRPPALGGPMPPVRKTPPPVPFVPGQHHHHVWGT